MSVLFRVFLVIVATHECISAPRPCPQFLPVAVQLDPHIQVIPSRASLSLKTSVKVKDDPKPPESNFVIFPSDLLQSHEKEITTKKLEVTSDLQSKSILETSSPKSKKRRRAKPKGQKNLILSPNTGWALKTINDQPAIEVLMTDKASIARDLKNSTESALIAVKRLEN